MFGLLKKLLRKRKIKPASIEVVDASRSPTSHKASSEWERELLESLVRNNLAPSEEVILHAFDLYKGELFDPLREQRLFMAERYTAIVAKYAHLQGLVPDMIARVAEQHPFEFSQTGYYREVH